MCEPRGMCKNVEGNNIHNHQKLGTLKRSLTVNGTGNL